MSRPADSASPNRPLQRRSEGRIVQLTAIIELAGYVSSDVRIGGRRVTLPNAVLREAAGDPSL